MKNFRNFSTLHPNADRRQPHYRLFWKTAVTVTGQSGVPLSSGSGLTSSLAAITAVQGKEEAGAGGQRSGVQPASPPQTASAGPQHVCPETEW